MVILLPAELVIVRLPPAVPVAVTSVILAALISVAISTASDAVVPNVAVPDVVVVKFTSVPFIVALKGGPPPTIPNANPTVAEVVTLKGPVPCTAVTPCVDVNALISVSASPTNTLPPVFVESVTAILLIVNISFGEPCGSITEPVIKLVIALATFKNTGLPVSLVVKSPEPSVLV